MADDRNDDTNKDDDLNVPDEFNPDDFGLNDANGSRDTNGTSFSDEELEAALAGFEQEFNDSGNGDDSSDPHDDGVASADTAGGDRTDLSAQFEDELAGLLGNKAKVAVVITRIASAELLAAFCQLSDISADCIGSPDGAIAVLRNLDGDGPEAAARDMTIVVSGMSVILAVNRADKLEATLYLQGKPAQTFAPPILFSATPPFVEDLMLGISTLTDLKKQGVKIVASSDYDHDAAMKILAEHTKFGRGGSSIQ
ncbi:hypothetical protein [Bifidobacterium simiiventris]|uniref:hypothetical protein n=1 Tax=Bifidobacterium simiiventris TaxID=2834434 RepID=UPI001F2C6CBB|nr:hypothetical protein [Bifidobacterium simiiventris]